jgi:RNA polymerase sigma factor (sigma-70 family)
VTPAELFDKHMGWAIRMAQFKADTQGLQSYRDDLKQAALLGLWQACLKYEERPGGFTVFAFMRVQGAMADMLRGEDWMPRTSRLRHEAGVTQVSMSRLQPADTAMVLQFASRQETPLAAVLRAESDSDVHVQKLLLLFPRAGRQRRVARMYFVYGLSAPQIAKRLGISESRVWQIHFEGTRAARRAARRKAAGL